MAYGQTGSGKTYTMGSEAHTELELMPNTGLIPRFLQDLFEQLSSTDCHLETSFLEVYGEDIHDLLDSSRTVLPLREDSGGGVVCTGLTSRSVTSAAEAVEVLHEGTLNRTTAATLMNLTSSRSHAVFTISLKRQNVSSKLTFVDLAGSERMKKTGAEGERAREGIEINKGLLALGNVINALADDERLQNGGKKIHVPYRQSKLTRLLQDALGGNSQTVFLACVSSADVNVSETLSTLHYANRARNIQNVPTRNIDTVVEQSQQWQAYISVLEAELIRVQFGQGAIGSSPIGKISDELAKQDNVNDYLTKLRALPLGYSGSGNAAFPHFQSQSPTCSRKTSGSDLALVLVPTLDANQSVSESFDPALLDEVNPDEELAILDQLLDLQQQDHDYDREQKKDHEELKQVQGELVEKENLLLQLRDSLKVYHNMKARYESLIVEVQNLELEKMELAEQLEKATNDPTLGCSRAIKKEMELVERSLVRARNETRKHRQMYKKAEHEAQKCHTLELKIRELKQGRANLIKKQREAASRHREMTETKTKEIMALKRKDRNAERKMSKLESEIQVHKRNLDSRQAYCKKLMLQKKQTEVHFMKLLAMRQRNLRDRTNKEFRREKGAPEANAFAPVHEQDDFAPTNEEIVSIFFLLDKGVEESVAYAELKAQYETRVAAYSDLMRAMVTAVKDLDESSEHERQELEHTIRELDLKVELSEAELDRIRARISLIEADNGDAFNSSMRQLLSDKPAPILRTLLLGTISRLTEIDVRICVLSIVHLLTLRVLNFICNLRFQIHRKQLANNLNIKENIVKSFEAEVDSLNNDIAALKKELLRRHSRANATGNDVEKIEMLQNEKDSLSLELDLSRQENLLLRLFSNDLAADYERTALALGETKEKLAFSEVAFSQSSGVHPPEPILTKLQETWTELGFSLGKREELCDQIKNCLELTCGKLLEEAEQQKEYTVKAISDVRREIDTIGKSLELEPMDITISSTSLLSQLDDFQRQQSLLKPVFQNAMNRRDVIAAKATDLAFALGISKELLDAKLIYLLENVSKTKIGSVETETMCISKLSDEFLSNCEEAVSELQMKKSKILTANSNLQSEILSLVTEMNLNESEVMFLVTHSIKQRLSSIPKWWDNEAAEMVTRSVTTIGGIVRSSQIFSQHLRMVHESLFSISKARRQLSNRLRAIIERAQQTLLKTVEGEFEANTEYSNFHEALFRLPSLSKDRIRSSFAEIEALSLGVDIMSQSEIEALAVVWEALNISAAKRGKFWASIDQAVREIDSQAGGPFDDIVALSKVDGEEWVLLAVKDGTRNFKELESRLLKLEMIHEEVEELRARQDSKSRIISLDTEVRILCAKLNEFEEKKCSKQRLTTKKNTSSTLLKEERFRRQMQLKFTAKLDQLASLVKSWKANENTQFDQDLLSDKVRTLLKNSDRNEFMHLRTVEYKSTSKRQADSNTSNAESSPPPGKRPKLSKRATLIKDPSKETKADSKDGSWERKRNRILSPFKLENSKASCEIERKQTRSPFKSEHNSSVIKPFPEKKRLVLDPFGNVLAQALSPCIQNKENP
jgi:Kinesin motor domain